MIRDSISDEPLHLNTADVHVWRISLRPAESRLSQL